MKNYISVNEAADALQCTRQEVVRKIWRGLIKAEKIGRMYVIKTTEIDKLKRGKKK